MPNLIFMLLFISMTMSFYSFCEHFLDDGVVAPRKEVSKKEEPPAFTGNKKDWEVVECYSNGTCKYKNVLTGEEKVFKSESVIQTSSETKKEPSKEELDFWNAKQVVTTKDLIKMFAISKKLGKKYIIMQVGNLAGCPPCQDIDRKIKEAKLEDKHDAVVIDFNYFNNRTSTLAKYLHDTKELPNGFSFPYIYTFQMKDDWMDYWGVIKNYEASIPAIESTIEKLKKDRASEAKK